MKVTLLFGVLWTALFHTSPLLATSLTLSQSGDNWTVILQRDPGVPVHYFHVDVSYDPTVLNPVKLEFTNLLGEPCVPFVGYPVCQTQLEAFIGMAIWRDTGYIDVYGYSYLPHMTLAAMQPESFPLYTVQFEQIGLGVPNVRIAYQRINQDEWVPEPASFVLAGGALILIAVLRSRCRFSGSVSGSCSQRATRVHTPSPA